MDYELAIVGGGPAGFTAGIYATRAGIKAMLFDSGVGGGLMAISPEIENYPGFKSISGMALSDLMREHVEKYMSINFGERVEKLEVSEDEVKITTSNRDYTVGAVIIATGTEHRKLGVNGEEKLQGMGVSYCATCDGPFFKGKKVLVVGGGNSALIEAIALKNMGMDVTLVHRRDVLRAEEVYEKRANEVGVNILYNTHLDEIKGENIVESVVLKNTKDGSIKEMEISGVFVSIGEMPQNQLAKQIGVRLDDNGYIKTDKNMRTNIKRIYAAGDITGGLRQIVTACAEGAIAALASTEVLGKIYPY
ncbi:MAG: thioredoxin-disulfide reductase [Methanomassiliicoccales archaeon]|nr:MAG: thioredoxin-disulfide reductase [Methanomassiliicoccales archaeon]